MRILLNVKIPHEPFNSLVRNAKAGELLGRILDEQQPGAVYFAEQNGRRGGSLIVELSDPSKIPALAEVWFLSLNADCEFRVVMNPGDLHRAGLDELGMK